MIITIAVSISMFIVFILWASCKVAGDADKRTEEMLRRKHTK